MTNYKSIQSEKKISELIVEFSQEHDAKSNSIELYTQLLRRFEGFLYANLLNPKAPKPKTIIDFKKSLQNEGYSTAYINLHLAALRIFFRWMAAKEYYANICVGIRSQKAEKIFRKTPLLMEDVKKLLLSIDTTTPIGLRDHALILLQFESGLRLGECLSIRQMDVDYRNSTVNILGKARHEREPVRVSTAAMGILRTYIKATADLRPALKQYAIDISMSPRGMNVIEHVKSKEYPVFLSHKKLVGCNEIRPLMRKDATRAINERLIKAGLKKPGVSPHSLRHGCGCHLILSGSSLYDVSVHLRHRDTNISRLYTQFIEKERALQKNFSNSISRELQNRLQKQIL